MMFDYSYFDLVKNTDLVGIDYASIESKVQAILEEDLRSYNLC